MAEPSSLFLRVFSRVERQFAEGRSTPERNRPLTHTHTHARTHQSGPGLLPSSLLNTPCLLSDKCFNGQPVSAAAVLRFRPTGYAVRRSALSHPPSPPCYRARFSKTHPSSSRVYTRTHSCATRFIHDVYSTTITIFFFPPRCGTLGIELDWFSNDFNSFDREFKQVIAEKIVLNNDKIRLRDSFFF